MRIKVSVPEKLENRAQPGREAEQHASTTAAHLPGAPHHPAPASACSSATAWGGKRPGFPIPPYGHPT